MNKDGYHWPVHRRAFLLLVYCYIFDDWQTEANNKRTIWVNIIEINLVIVLKKVLCFKGVWIMWEELCSSYKALLISKWKHHKGFSVHTQRSLEEKVCLTGCLLSDGHETGFKCSINVLNLTWSRSPVDRFVCCIFPQSSISRSQSRCSLRISTIGFILKLLNMKFPVNQSESESVGW